eukprot:gene2478-2819_t
MKDDGSLISSAESSGSDHNTSKIVSAITSSIWTSFCSDDDLQYQLIDCEAQKLREYLQEPLKNVEQV